MAISSGSSAGSTHLRKIMMLVSRSPWAGRSSGIRIGHVLIASGILISPEGAGVDRGGGARHGGELLPGNETPPPAQRDQLTDAVTIAGDRESLPVLDCIHDLLGSVAQVALGDFRLVAHSPSLGAGSTSCYWVLHGRGAGSGQLVGDPAVFTDYLLTPPIAAAHLHALRAALVRRWTRLGRLAPRARARLPLPGAA